MVIESSYTQKLIRFDDRYPSYPKLYTNTQYTSMQTPKTRNNPYIYIYIYIYW